MTTEAPASPIPPHPPLHPPLPTPPHTRQERRRARATETAGVALGAAVTCVVPWIGYAFALMGLLDPMVGLVLYPFIIAAVPIAIIAGVASIVALVLGIRLRVRRIVVLALVGLALELTHLALTTAALWPLVAGLTS